jgi:hypothetical protein
MASLSVSGTISYDTTATGRFIVSGGSSASAVEPWIGDVYWIAVWNLDGLGGSGAIAPTLAWLQAEPYVFLRPVVRRRWFVPAAAGTPVSASASPPWEAVARVTPTSVVSPWEAVARLAPVASSTPWESLAPVAPQSGVSPWESLTGATAATTGPWEALARASTAPAVPWEGLGRIVSPGSAVWESVQPVSRALTSAWEALSRVATAAVSAWESGGLVGVLGSIPWEAAGQAILRRLRTLLWVGE